MEVSYRLFILISRFLICRNKTIRMPLIQSLLIIHHQSVILRHILSVRRCIIEIENRQLTFIFCSTERTSWLSGIIKDIPMRLTFRILTRLNQITSFNQSIFPFGSTWTSRRIMKSIYKSSIKQLFQIRTTNCIW